MCQLLDGNPESRQTGTPADEGRGDRDPPLMGPGMGFAHLGLNPFLQYVALHLGKKWIPGL